MTWENSKNYGLIRVMENGSIRLYYDRNYFLLAPNPNPMMKVVSAFWQGEHVMVHGLNQYGEPLCYVLRGLYTADIIG